MTCRHMTCYYIKTIINLDVQRQKICVNDLNCTYALVIFAAKTYIRRNEFNLHSKCLFGLNQFVFVFIYKCFYVFMYLFIHLFYHSHE